MTEREWISNDDVRRRKLCFAVSHSYSLSSREAAEEKQPKAAAAFSAPFPSPVELRRGKIVWHPSCRPRRPDALLCGWHRIGPRWLCCHFAVGGRHCGLRSDRTIGWHEILLEHPA